MTIANARSLRSGNVTSDEVRELVPLIRTKGVGGGIREMVDELDSYDGDIYIHDGDLTIAGDFDAGELGVLLLWVKGTLTVEGGYRDTDDPQTIVVVTGDLRARDVVTAGFLEVHGNMTVTGRVIGDYNDCQAWIGGDLTCSLFYPEEHYFNVGGWFRATTVLGNSKHRVSSPHPVTDGIGMGDARILEFLDRELVNVHEDDGELDVDGLKDFGALKRRVIAGAPLRAPG